MARSDKAVAKASILMTLNNKQFKKCVAETRKSWEGLTQRVRELNNKYFNNSPLGQGLADSMQKITGTVSKAGAIFKILINLLRQIAAAAAAAGAAIAGAFAAGVGASIREAAKFEKEALGLKLVMGETAGGELASWVQKFYPGTSGSRSVFLQAAQDLSRLGLQTPAVKDLLQAMGDAGALSGAGTDQGIQVLTRAFRELYATGSLNNRVLRQFRSVGVDFLSILATQYGSVAEAQEAVKNGSISAAQAQMLFLQYMGQYYGAMQAYSNTTLGTLDTIRALLSNLGAAIGEGFLPALKVMGGTVQDFLNYLISIAPNISRLINDIIGKVAEQVPGILSFLQKAVNLLGSVYDWLSSIVELFYKLFTGQLFTREGWREFDQNNQKRWARITGGNWSGTAAKQFLGSDLNTFLSGYGLSPEQIKSGMAAQAATRAADNLKYASGGGALSEGTRLFGDTRINEQMLAELQGVNEKLDNIGSQNQAGKNAEIPVRGYGYIGGV